MVKLFIGNIKEGSDSEKLRGLFEAYGAVTECVIVSNYGFCHMEDQAAAEQAINELNDIDFEGNKLSVLFSTGRKKGDKFFHGNGAMGGRGGGPGGPMRGGRGGPYNGSGMRGGGGLMRGGRGGMRGGPMMPGRGGPMRPPPGFRPRPWENESGPGMMGPPRRSAPRGDSNGARRGSRGTRGGSGGSRGMKSGPPSSAMYNSAAVMGQDPMMMGYDNAAMYGDPNMAAYEGAYAAFDPMTGYAIDPYYGTPLDAMGYPMQPQSFDANGVPIYDAYGGAEYTQQAYDQQYYYDYAYDYSQDPNYVAPNGPAGNARFNPYARQ